MIMIVWVWSVSKLDTNMIISAWEGSTNTAAFSPSGSYQTTIVVIIDNDSAG